MKKLITLIFGTALLFSTSAYSDVMVGVKVGNGDLEGTSKAYTAGSRTTPATTASKDSNFGAIFAEISMGDTGLSIGVEHVPLDADITLNGANSSTSANVSDFTTGYLLYMHQLDSASVYAKAGYSHAEIGAIKSKSTVVNQSDSLEGYMVGAGIQIPDFANGLVGRFEATYTEFDDVTATTTSAGSTSVAKKGSGELVTFTFGVSKSF